MDAQSIIYGKDISPTKVTGWHVYNPTMAIFDEKTKYVPSTNPGTVDYMAVGPTADGKTQVSFIQILRKTGDHVDEAAIMSQASLSIEDLKGLQDSIVQRLKDLTS